MVAAAPKPSALSRIALTGALVATLLGGWGFSVTAQARGPQGDGVIALEQLPEQGRKTYSAILSGGPFRYDKDGSVFGNRERLLPRERRGHYREYTVQTPGARNRGAQRIVCGGPATRPQACWFTADHYASFQRIVP